MDRSESPILPIACVERLIRQNANAKRVSNAATKVLAEALEEYGTKVALEAVRLAKYAGRKTVKEEDIKLAVK